MEREQQKKKKNIKFFKSYKIQTGKIIHSGKSLKCSNSKIPSVYNAPGTIYSSYSIFFYFFLYLIRICVVYAISSTLFMNSVWFWFHCYKLRNFTQEKKILFWEMSNSLEFFVFFYFFFTSSSFGIKFTLIFLNWKLCNN